MSARRPLFNAIVAPLAAGPMSPADAKGMLDNYRAEVLREDGAETLRLRIALLDLHPKTANPRHGCCAPPKLCKGHRPECRSSEHTIGGGDPWPCATLRAAGIASDEDAVVVRRMAEGAGPAGKDTRAADESTRPPLGEFVPCALGCSCGEWEGRALERGWTAAPAGLACPQHDTGDDAQPVKLRAQLAAIVRTFAPRDPQGEADEAIAFALNLAANAVERGHR